MTDYTVDEIESAIRFREDGENEFYYDMDDRPSQLTLILRGAHEPVKVIELDSGGEGHGESVYAVFQVGDQLFRKDGYYASHYGTDWDGALYEVEPVERTIVAYEMKR